MWWLLVVLLAKQASHILEDASRWATSGKSEFVSALHAFRPQRPGPDQSHSLPRLLQYDDPGDPDDFEANGWPDDTEGWPGDTEDESQEFPQDASSVEAPDWQDNWLKSGAGKQSGVGATAEAPFYPGRPSRRRREKWKRLRVILVVIWNAVVVVVFCVTFVVIGFIYKNNTFGKRPTYLPPGQVTGGVYSMRGSDAYNDFKHGIFSCCDDCTLCCHAVFCFPARAGDTYSAVGVGGFWGMTFWIIVSYVVGWALESIVIALTAGEPSHGSTIAHVVASLMPAVYGFRRRQALREFFNGDPAPHCVADFCCHWWCSLCVVAQEARQIDGAHNVRMQCCAQLVPLHAAMVSPQMVGVPVCVPVVNAGMPGAPIVVQGHPVQASQSVVIATAAPVNSTEMSDMKPVATAIAVPNPAVTTPVHAVVSAVAVQGNAYTDQALRGLE